MESNDVYGRLKKSGFTSAQIESLGQLRSVYAEKELILLEHRRLEFARWLVDTGRLTDEIHPSKKRAR